MKRRNNRKNKEDREPSPSPSHHCDALKNKSDFQRFHLVVDLDATCVSTLAFDDDTNGKSSYEKVQSIIKKAEGSLNHQILEAAEDLKKRVHLFSLNDGLEPYKMWTILRPDVFEFFEFAALYFSRITIWSAGKEDYVNEITALLFPPYMARPELVLSWGDCMKTFVVKDAKGKKKFEKTTSDMSSSGSTDMFSFGKPLDYLSGMIGDHRRDSDPRHMLIIDDRADIASENINNLVQVPAYSPGFSEGELLGETKKDTVLRDFTEWLMSPEVYKSSDIRKIDKTSIFNSRTATETSTPAIASPSHAPNKKSPPKKKPKESNDKKINIKSSKRIGKGAEEGN